MKKIPLFSIILLVSCLAVFGQKREFVANFPCENIEINCASVVRQELTVLTNFSEFKSLFPDANNLEKQKGCQLAKINFDDYFLVCLKPNILFGCHEPDINVHLNWENGKNLGISLEIKEYGNCYQLWPCEIWLKMPLKYYTETVDFAVSREKRSHIE